MLSNRDPDNHRDDDTLFGELTRRVVSRSSTGSLGATRDVPEDVVTPLGSLLQDWEEGMDLEMTPHRIT
jgi:hypothetical protein